jgi:hypothetical protein
MDAQKTPAPSGNQNQGLPSTPVAKTSVIKKYWPYIAVGVAIAAGLAYVVIHHGA